MEISRTDRTVVTYDETDGFYGIYAVENLDDTYVIDDFDVISGMYFDENVEHDIGVFEEDIINIVIHRLRTLQSSREAALAITKLQEAIHWLDARPDIT